MPNEFPRTAVLAPQSRWHKTTEISVPVPDDGSPKSKCHGGSAVLPVRRVCSVPFSASGVTSHPGSSLARRHIALISVIRQSSLLRVSLSRLPSVRVCLCLLSLFLVGTASFWLRAHFHPVGPHLNLNTSSKTLFPKTVTFANLRDWDTYLWWGGHIQCIKHEQCDATCFLLCSLDTSNK